jgi:hypothetical protein
MVPLCVILSLMIVPMERQARYYRIVDRVGGRFVTLPPAPALQADPAMRLCLCNGLRTAWYNIFVPSQVPLAELVRIEADLERRFRERPMDVEDVRWIWRRLGEASPSARSYTTRNAWLIENCIPPAPPGG